MKIAIFSDCYLDLTGGIVSSINAQRKALEARGHEVYVFSSGYPRSEAERKKLASERVFVVPSCRWCFRGLTPVARRPGVIEKWLLAQFPELGGFDVFYVHYEGGCSIAGLRLARRLGVPSVQVMHGREDVGEANIIPLGLRTVVAVLLNWFHSWYLPHPLKIRRDDYLAQSVAAARMWTLMVNHANYADVVVTPSEHFRKKLIHYGVDKPVEVVPNGYPDEYFPAKVTVRKLSEGEELKMIWHSRVSGEKRIMPFLEALTKVRGRYRLDVYGGGGDLKRAERFAREYELPVVFHGNVKFE
ncbi:glycosyltransferase, partial [Candidatus Saccharibacteria bacterium]|nr:glycosyltransferase [Candidatus Saccharibacteria bacterium]